MKAASRDVAAGVGDPAKVLELNRAYEKQAATVRDLSREYRGLNAEVKQTQAATPIGIKNIGNLAASFTSLGGVLRVFKGGLAALGIGEFVSQIIGGIDDFNKSMLDLNKLAEATDLKPEIIKEWRIEAKKLNVDADAVINAYVRFNRSLSEARIKSQDASREVSKFGTVTLRGSEAADEAGARVVRFGNAVGNAARQVNVLHGAQRKQIDLGNPFKTAEIDVKNYTDAQIKSGDGARDFLQVLKELDKSGQGALANALSAAVMGSRNLKEATVAFDAFLKVLERAGTLKPLGPAIDNAKAFNDALVDVEKTAMVIPKAIFAALTPLVTSFLQEQVEANKRSNENTIANWNALVSFVTETAIPTLKSAWASFWADLNQLFVGENWLNLWKESVKIATDALSSIGEWFGNLMRGIGQSIKNFGSQVAQGAGSFLSNIPAIPFASGGRVPGTGRGDTVPAMLTPGEFVIRRAVVDALGPSFFARLNGGMGGMLPRRHFASGGLVAAEPAGGGTPVHLHIGGGSFPLNGAPAVVSALVVEAHRQHIRSAGQKPSWYGGR